MSGDREWVIEAKQFSRRAFEQLKAGNPLANSAGSPAVLVAQNYDKTNLRT